jgi:Ca-activated chloride channel homolog
MLSAMINSSIVESRNVKKRAWADILCAGFAAGALALFSGPAPAQKHSPEPTFRADTNLVVIPVAVTDTLNRFILGLQKTDFHLFEDGVEQDVAHFSGEDAPLSIGLVFDESGSMDYKLRNSRDAAAHFLKTLNRR